MTVNVLALYADKTGCGQYRVLFPAEAVNKQRELDMKVRTADYLDADAVYDGPRVRIRRVGVPPGIHVVTFQRPMRAALVGAMMWLKERRPDIGLVVELDDDLMSLPGQHEAFGALNPRISPTENTTWLRRALTLADVVTVSTPELAKRYGRSRPTFVIRNGVPNAMTTQCPSRAMTDAVRNREKIVGWAGYTGTHPGDLEVTSGAVADLLDRSRGRVRFRNIGPREGVEKALQLPPGASSLVEASGWLEPTMYRLGLASLDIGIVPLQDTAFNQAKSALKALEFAAAGVPVVASDLPEFVTLRDAGLPIYLAKGRRKDWTSALNRLLSLSDDNLRQLAHAHRQWVIGHATVGHHAPEWAHAWRHAASVAQRRIKNAA